MTFNLVDCGLHLNAKNGLRHLIKVLLHFPVEVKVESTGINPTFHNRIFLGFPDLNSLEISYNSVMMPPPYYSIGNMH